MHRLHVSQFLKVHLGGVALIGQCAPHDSSRAVERNESTQIDDYDSYGPPPRSAKRYHLHCPFTTLCRSVKVVANLNQQEIVALRRIGISDRVT
jgi:hypothetical protein